MEDFGAAQPIKDALSKKKDTPPPAKPNTAWHDDKVKAANDAFRKKAEQGKGEDMAAKKKVTPDDATKGDSRPQKDYADAESRAGNFWLKRNSGIKESNIDDDRREVDPDKYLRRTADNTRKMQMKDRTESMRTNVAGGGAIPSYKKGGKIKATGLAKVHKGERVIPKAKVAKVEKLMRKRG